MAKEAKRIADQLDTEEEARYQNALLRRIQEVRAMREREDVAMKAEVAAEERAAKEAAAIEARETKERKERDEAEARKAQAAADFTMARREDERHCQEKAAHVKAERAKEREEDERRRQQDVAHFKEEARQMRLKDEERAEEERRRLEREERRRMLKAAYEYRKAFNEGRRSQREETWVQEDQAAARREEQRLAALQLQPPPPPLVWPRGSPAPAPAGLAAASALYQAGVMVQGQTTPSSSGTSWKGWLKWWCVPLDCGRRMPHSPATLQPQVFSRSTRRQRQQRLLFRLPVTRRTPKQRWLPNRRRSSASRIWLSRWTMGDGRSSPSQQLSQRCA